MLLMACRGDKALAGHLKGLGYQVSMYNPTDNIKIHILWKQGSNGSMTCKVETVTCCRHNINHGCLLEPSIYSAVGYLVSLQPEDLPLLMAMGDFCKITRRGNVHAYNIHILAQDLLGYHHGK
jgi:hypothetical protein